MLGVNSTSRQETKEREAQALCAHLLKLKGHGCKIICPLETEERQEWSMGLHIWLKRTAAFSESQEGLMNTRLEPCDPQTPPHFIHHTPKEFVNIRATSYLKLTSRDAGSFWNWSTTQPWSWGQTSIQGHSSLTCATVATTLPHKTQLTLQKEGEPVWIELPAPSARVCTNLSPVIQVHVYNVFLGNAVLPS